MGKCTHISQAMRRQFSPGSLLLLLFAGIVFGPQSYDWIQGEPALTNHLAVVTTSQGAVLVQDVTQTRRPVYGLRANTIEREDGAVVCSTEHHNSWRGERNRLWEFRAFTSCAAPAYSFKICSNFAVQSDSGRQRYLGPFCSSLTDPPGD